MYLPRKDDNAVSVSVVVWWFACCMRCPEPTFSYFLHPLTSLMSVTTLFVLYGCCLPSVCFENRTPQFSGPESMILSLDLNLPSGSLNSGLLVLSSEVGCASNGLDHRYIWSLGLKLELLLAGKSVSRRRPRL